MLILFLALWLAPGRAAISWDAPGRACLFRNETFVGCWDGPARVVLGGPNTDFRYRPAAGDVFRLVVDSSVYTAPLQSVIRLPITAR